LVAWYDGKDMTDRNKQITINYTNWKGATADRVVVPIKIWFGKTQWHPGEQWFLTAFDVSKQTEREFALKDIHNIGDVEKEAQLDLGLNAHSEPQKKANVVKLFTDGGSRGNPGPSAIGYAIYDLEDNLLHKDSKYLGITTNNQAEYQGLKVGLEKCRSLNIREVQVHMDSLLVVNQMKGVYKVKNRDLWPVHESLKVLIAEFSKVTFTHVPRELNKLADSMVNECLDAQIE